MLPPPECGPTVQARTAAGRTGRLTVPGRPESPSVSETRQDKAAPGGFASSAEPTAAAAVRPLAAGRDPSGDGSQPIAVVTTPIDSPDSPRLARQVLYCDGLVCANPGRSRRCELHGRHIVLRFRGRPTVPWNGVAVCDVCHALIHQGLLDVIGSPDIGLIWQPRPRGTGVKVRDLAGLRARLASLGEDLEPSNVHPACGAHHPLPASVPATDSDGRSTVAPGLWRPVCVRRQHQGHS